MRSRTYVLAFIVLLLVYVGLTFGLPVDPETLQRYKLTESQIKLVNLTIVLPVILIWLTALYGFVNLKKYAQTVADTKEGKAFGYLTLGLMVLAFSLPINAIISSLAKYISINNSEMLTATTITRNYITLIFSLATFMVLITGATALAKTVKRKSIPTVPASFAIGLISLSVVYTWLITAKPINQGIDERAYFLPSWLLILTVVIPYLLAWRAGLAATYYLYTFHQNVKGVIYKSAFKDLAMGIGVVVMVSILIQLLTTSSARLSTLNLTPILLIIYVLLALYAVGFGFVARGAKKLKRFEDL